MFQVITRKISHFLLPSFRCILEDTVWTLTCSLYSAWPAQGFQRVQDLVQWEVCELTRLYLKAHVSPSVYDYCVRSLSLGTYRISAPIQLAQILLYSLHLFSVVLNFFFLFKNVIFSVSLSYFLHQLAITTLGFYWIEYCVLSAKFKYNGGGSLDSSITCGIFFPTVSKCVLCFWLYNQPCDLRWSCFCSGPGAIAFNSWILILSLLLLWLLCCSSQCDRCELFYYSDVVSVRVPAGNRWHTWNRLIE